MEIAIAIGGALLAPAFEALLNQLASQNLIKYAREGDVLTELNKWKEMLQGIYGVLEDAEEKQRTNKSVEMWVSQLRDLAYDVEDILDEFDIEARQRNLEAERLAGTSKVRKLFPNCCAGLNLNAVKFNNELISKIKGISTQLEVITSQKNHLELRKIGREGTSRVRERIPTTSLVNKAEVYGREEDKKAILELLNTESTNGRFSVIPIVGMGGLGKTTLAQVIFDEAGKVFDLTAWVSVGYDDFDIIRITKTILQSFGGDFGAKDLNLLQVKLKVILSEKKFLIVLDDVWNEKYEDWSVFRSPFEYGAKGSRIIVTARNQNVSQMMGTAGGYPLKELMYDDCLSVFVQHALGAANFDEHLDLEAVGKKIVQRCQGLPLAAKAIGGLLRGQLNHSVWENVLNSAIWEEKSGILPALRLSYHQLPSHLKRCFAYCAIFPKDYEFNEYELVLQWMAEGFLLQSEGMKQMEDLGHVYFRDLFLRSFFQQSTSNKSRYVMHDLIHDLAQSVSREVCFNLDDKLKGAQSFTKVRHSTFTCQHIDIYQRFEAFYKMSNLRTFLALPRFTWRDNFISIKVVHDLVPKLKCLRVLSLAGYKFEELSGSIGALKHLRYIDLSYTNIERLPKSLSNLCNLQTLKLNECKYLMELPTGIGNLINLMHLDLIGTDALQEIPLEIANLTNLQTLSRFIVGKGNGIGIIKLMNFPHLQGQLCIEGLKNVVSIHDAEFADVKKEEGLEELALLWTGNLHDSRSEEEELVLSLLQPHQNLAKLSVKFYGGKKFPLWIGDSTFTNMVDLELCNCQNIMALPPLGGLPKLRKLSIKGMGGVKEVGVEFYGDNSSTIEPFPSLETLEIENMPEWEQWAWSNGDNEDIAGSFPKLCELSLINCPKLAGKLPSCFPSLKTLDVAKCQEMILRSVPDLISLATLKIEGISGLASLHEVVTQALVALEYLQIYGCDQLRYLWEDSTNLDKLACLNHLRIDSCKKLVSLVAGEAGLLPCNLEVLRIYDCENFENLPKRLPSLTFLRDLIIYHCPKLVSFPAPSLPCSLKNLEISDCDSLESLPEGIMHDSNAINEMLHPETLCVVECPSLTSLPIGEFPHSVKILELCNWTTQLLESLHDRFSHLTTLEIRNSPILESFPESGLSIPNLRSFTIRYCENLRSLPNQMQNLRSLLYLAIEGCGGLVSFPDGGLPPNLISLKICYCKNMKQPMLEWRLKRLNFLTDFRIVGASPSTDIASFPDEEGQLLPSSLINLRINGLKNLKSISRSIHSLTSLDALQIYNCPKLRSLPKKALPATLGTLSIFNCPLIKKRCTKEKGDYWRFIANIPCLKIY